MPKKSSCHYVGKELDLFSEAKNWKSYWSGKIAPMIGAEVLEIGAGIGANTIVLCSSSQKRWLCVEPDEKLFNQITERIGKNTHFCKVETKKGTLQSIRHGEYFDTILYIDVLEHIDEDKIELELAGKYLRRQGILIVIAPAHQWLYSPFDNTIGHYRRYTKETLRAIGPSSLKLKKIYYLDSAGLIASLGNLLILRRGMPTQSQIRFWDKFLIPISRKLDPCFGWRVGKTVVGIWEKEDT